MDGLFFNLSDGSSLSSLNFYPEENTLPVTDIQAEEDGVTGLPGGPEAGGTFDVGLQFGEVADSTAGNVISANFTLWSGDGPLSFEDIDLAGMRLMVNSDGPDGAVLGVSDSDDPDFMPGDGTPDSDLSLTDVMSLMSLPPGEDEEGTDDDPDALSEIPFV
jgi:hypothetical protein